MQNSEIALKFPTKKQTNTVGFNISFLHLGEGGKGEIKRHKLLQNILQYISITVTVTNTHPQVIEIETKNPTGECFNKFKDFIFTILA